MAAEGDAAQGEADMEEGGPPAADSRALARAMAEGATAMVAEAWVMVEREGAATARVATMPPLPLRIKCSQNIGENRQMSK